jgi:membrane-bound serine protease (ClpP class)
MSRVVFRALGLVFFLALIVGALLPLTTQAAGQSVHVLHVEGTIVPIVADYIERGIAKAEDENATACVIELDTPGGLLDPTESIVQAIMNANVPVIVYVNPKGAWAASAGTFITLSAHIAAMTPGTTIGAAHPVSGGGEQISEDEMQKIVAFSAKWMAAIAQERGRNIEEAQLAVTESKSFTDVDALNANLINLRADSLEDLMAQINGWKVTLASGREVTIDTSNYVATRDEMSLIERFLHTISDPNIAYILLSIGSLGIIAEIYHPGAFFPGITGAICLLLAFYSLGVLDARWGGILLIMLSFGLFIAELFTHSFGVLTAGGITSLVLGSLILFPESGALFQVSPWLIAIVAILIAAFFTFVIQRVIRVYHRQAYTGREEMVGKTALAKTALEPEGMVFFKGERWTAVVDKGRVKPGEEVTITRVEGLKLYVARKKTRGK